MEDNRHALLERETEYYDNCPGCKIDRLKEQQRGIPYKHLSFIWIVSLCTALPTTSLFPFVYFMIRDFHIAKTEEDIGFYAGFVGSSFMVGRALTSIFWGVVADRYGRKPIILIGTFSVVIFNGLLGLSTNFWMALSMRFLLGCFNSLLGTIRAYASEVCREEHRGLALSVVSTSRGIGLIIGPAIGGFFAQPAEKYPIIFSRSSIFGRFPYFLPCFIISAYAVAVLILCRWLPETLHIHNRKADERNDQFDGLEPSSKTSGQEDIIEPEKTQKTHEPSLLKNWPLMSTIIVYCVFSLQEMAYSEAISIPLLSCFPYIAMLSGIILHLVINVAVIIRNTLSVSLITGIFILLNNAVPQSQRGAANGISMTAMSFFKAFGPAGGGALFSWAQKRQVAAFLPGDQMVFFALNVVQLVGLLLTFKPFLAQPRQ